MVSPADFVSVDAILSLLGIVIGITIFLMQRRADSKINGIIETQFRRQELEKKYFGARLVNNLGLIGKNYGKLEQYLSDYLKDHSQSSMNKAKSFASFQSTNLDEYVVPAMRGDLGRLIEFIDDLELVDQLSSAFDDLSSLYKDCCVDSTFEESESEIRGKIESAKAKSEMIYSLLSRFEEEVPKTIE